MTFALLVLSQHSPQTMEERVEPPRDSSCPSLESDDEGQKPTDDEDFLFDAFKLEDEDHSSEQPVTKEYEMVLPLMMNFLLLLH